MAFEHVIMTLFLNRWGLVFYLMIWLVKLTDMKLKAINIKEFAQQSEILNTINGGVVNTYMDISQNDNEIVVKLNTPGIDGQDYQIMIDQNKILVYTLHNFYIHSKSEVEDHESLNVPLFNRVLDIPHFVDSNKISAEAKHDLLQIYLPFKDSKDIKPRKVDIKSR